jgi:hypothetical protein
LLNPFLDERTLRSPAVALHLAFRQRSYLRLKARVHPLEKNLHFPDLHLTHPTSPNTLPPFANASQAR